MAFEFSSPTVKVREIDNSVRTQNPALGLTAFGIVGEFPKGPAFEPILVTNQAEKNQRFGISTPDKIGNKLQYAGSYYADSFLEEGDNLTIVRVLGKSGYDAGQAFAIRLSANIDLNTTAITSTNILNGVDFSGNTYEGDTITGIGTIGVIEPVFTKLADDSFSGTQINYTSITYDAINLSGTVDTEVIEISGASIEGVNNAIIGVLRSRGTYTGFSNNDLVYDTSAITFTPNDAATDPTAQFSISTDGFVGPREYSVSLDPTSRDFIGRVLGRTTRATDESLFVEYFYEESFEKFNGDGQILGIKDIITIDTNVFSDYNEQFQTPITPFVVSELRGNRVERLFRCVSISDGDSANREIKISIQNIDPQRKTFDLIIRDYNDTDNNPVVLEAFTNCTMEVGSTNYVGRRIGAVTVGNTELDYEIISRYIYLEIPEDAPQDAFPAGFEGYLFREYTNATTGLLTTGATVPISYKRSYLSTDNIRRTYLGISERGYDSATSTGNGLNNDLYRYVGKTTTGLTKTSGFHLDSGATDSYSAGTITIGTFATGAGEFRDFTDTQSGPYADSRSRKFTFVPAGGFDGFDIYRTTRTNTDTFIPGNLFAFNGSDYEAYRDGYRVFNNPEETVINIFSTPGLDWSNNNALVKEALEMIEEERQDALYLIDAPNLTTPGEVGAEEIVDLLDIADIDSNYAATYYPYIKVLDTATRQNLFLSPSGEAARAMAFTDKTRFVWFAPAGYTRGLIPNAIDVRHKFKESDRDILYDGRINPIAKFNDVGVDIFGQKTLQIQESALDRINVRRLLLFAKGVVIRIGRSLLFEPNDDTLVNQFIDQVNPILGSIQRNRGLQRFNVSTDPTLDTPEARDRNERYFLINLTPTPATEAIGVTFQINSITGEINFNDN